MTNVYTFADMISDMAKKKAAVDQPPSYESLNGNHQQSWKDQAWNGILNALFSASGFNTAYTVGGLMGAGAGAAAATSVSTGKIIAGWTTQFIVMLFWGSAQYVAKQTLQLGGSTIALIGFSGYSWLASETRSLRETYFNGTRFAPTPENNASSGGGFGNIPFQWSNAGSHLLAACAYLSNMNYFRAFAELGMAWNEGILLWTQQILTSIGVPSVTMVAPIVISVAVILLAYAHLWQFNILFKLTWAVTRFSGLLFFKFIKHVPWAMLKYVFGKIRGNTGTATSIAALEEEALRLTVAGHLYAKYGNGLDSQISRLCSELATTDFFTRPVGSIEDLKKMRVELAEPALALSQETQQLIIDIRLWYLCVPQEQGQITIQTMNLRRANVMRQIGSTAQRNMIMDIEKKLKGPESSATSGSAEDKIVAFLESYNRPFFLAGKSLPRAICSSRPEALTAQQAQAWTALQEQQAAQQQEQSQLRAEQEQETRELANEIERLKSLERLQQEEVQKAETLRFLQGLQRTRAQIAEDQRKKLEDQLQRQKLAREKLQDDLRQQLGLTRDALQDLVTEQARVERLVEESRELEAKHAREKNELQAQVQMAELREIQLKEQQERKAQLNEQKARDAKAEFDARLQVEMQQAQARLQQAQQVADEQAAQRALEDQRRLEAEHAAQMELVQTQLAQLRDQMQRQQEQDEAQKVALGFQAQAALEQLEAQQRAELLAQQGAPNPQPGVETLQQGQPQTGAQTGAIPQPTQATGDNPNMTRWLVQTAAGVQQFAIKLQANTFGNIILNALMLVVFNNLVNTTLNFVPFGHTAATAATILVSAHQLRNNPMGLMQDLLKGFVLPGTLSYTPGVGRLINVNYSTLMFSEALRSTAKLAWNTGVLQTSMKLTMFMWQKGWIQRVATVTSYVIALLSHIFSQSTINDALSAARAKVTAVFTGVQDLALWIGGRVDRYCTKVNVAIFSALLAALFTGMIGMPNIAPDMAGGRLWSIGQSMFEFFSSGSGPAPPIVEEILRAPIPEPEVILDSAQTLVAAARALAGASAEAASELLGDQAATALGLIGGFSLLLVAASMIGRRKEPEAKQAEGRSTDTLCLYEWMVLDNFRLECSRDWLEAKLAGAELPEIEFDPLPCLPRASRNAELWLMDLRQNGLLSASRVWHDKTLAEDAAEVRGWFKTLQPKLLPDLEQDLVEHLAEVQSGLAELIEGLTRGKIELRG